MTETQNKQTNKRVRKTDEKDKNESTSLFISSKSEICDPISMTLQNCAQMRTKLKKKKGRKNEVQRNKQREQEQSSLRIECCKLEVIHHENQETEKQKKKQLIEWEQKLKKKKKIQFQAFSSLFCKLLNIFLSAFFSIGCLAEKLG